MNRKAATDGPSGPSEEDVAMAKSYTAQGPEALKGILKKLEETTGRPVELMQADDPNAEAANLTAVALAVKAFRAAIIRASSA
jgi:hypothetical protein